jgi:DNA-binding CsgD family transcriptional regulator
MLAAGAILDPSESRRIEAASRVLDLLPANAPASGIFDAIRLCMPVQAGLFSFIRPSMPDALVSQAVGLEQGIYEKWLSTPPAMLEQILAPLVSSRVGSLWRDSETLQGEQREQLEVLALLDTAGLGEGAGYKAIERTIPWYGTEHVTLALLMARRQRVPARSEVLLAALTPAIQRAILRLALPLLAHQPIHAQIVAEQSLGYLCLSPNGSLTETNLRAHRLVDVYADAARIERRRGATAAFAAQALERTRGGRLWQLPASDHPSTLQVDAHRLAKETHVLPGDVILLQMREVLPSAFTPEVACAWALLTKRERQIALCLARTVDSAKQIAVQLSISPETMRTHVERIYRKLGVQSRPQLTALLR